MQKSAAWHLTFNNGKPRIRRIVAGEWETYPRSKYLEIAEDREALKDLVIRLNNKSPEAVKLRAKIEIRHAFISPALLERYYDWLSKKMPHRRNARRNWGYVLRHVLGYFVQTRQFADPVSWKKNELDWKEYLAGEKLAGPTIKQIVVEANRFLAWLHAERPEEVKPIRLEPFDRYLMRDHEAQRAARGDVNHSQHIKRETVDSIMGKVRDERLKVAVFLAHRYGLREAEVVGLIPKDVRKFTVNVERQLLALPAEGAVYGPLKGKDMRPRQVSHWWADAHETLKAVKTLHQSLITPGYLCKLWAEEMRRLDYDYRFHDLRHGFATDSIRKYGHRDTQLALGHKHAATTDRYAHDDRELDNAPLEELETV